MHRSPSLVYAHHANVLRYLQGPLQGRCESPDRKQTCPHCSNIPTCVWLQAQGAARCVSALHSPRQSLRRTSTGRRYNRRPCSLLPPSMPCMSLETRAAHRCSCRHGTRLITLRGNTGGSPASTAVRLAPPTPASSRAAIATGGSCTPGASCAPCPPGHLWALPRLCLLPIILS